MRPLVLAVLDTMWGSRVEAAPRLFVINRHNHSGKRLYKLVGSNARLLVTNACPQTTTHATHHSKPDPEWLRYTIRMVRANHRPRLILVCGTVARKTFQRAGLGGSNVIYMPHPASRTWTRAQLAAMQATIQKRLQ